MSKEQIIDEVYKNYEEWWIPYIHPVDYARDGIPYYSKEEFINKCKTDPEFSERWGLKIEERELSISERINLFMQGKKVQRFLEKITNKDLHDSNIPTKLITITYKNETIKSNE